MRAGTQLNPGLRAISAIRSNAAITSTHGQNQRFCRSGHDIRIDIYNPAKSIAAMMAGPSAMNPNSAKPSETAIPNAAATNTSMVVRSRKRRLEGRLDVCTWTCLQAVAMAASGRFAPGSFPAQEWTGSYRGEWGTRRVGERRSRVDRGLSVLERPEREVAIRRQPTRDRPAPVVAVWRFNSVSRKRSFIQICAANLGIETCRSAIGQLRPLTGLQIFPVDATSHPLGQCAAGQLSSENDPHAACMSQ